MVKILFAVALGLCIGFLTSKGGSISRIDEVSDTAQRILPVVMAPSNLTDRMALALVQTPIGSLGPKRTEREHLVYYDSLFFLSMQYGRDAKTLLEVGCANDPFAQYLSWIDQRKCVAPYQVKYNGKNQAAVSDVEFIEADFMKFREGQKYDLLVCSQVVEHVPDPGSFMKKLITTAKTSIISVPYMWPACKKGCNHLSNNINLDTILEWSYPHKPMHHAIITEETAKTRIVVIFQN